MIKQNVLLTADSVIFFFGPMGTEVLLIKRRSEPFKDSWALSGGFLEDDEPLEDGALRELEEETGLKLEGLQQIGAFGDPDRDPRGRTVTIAFWGTTDKREEVQGSDDASEAAWHPVADLPRLAFDHRKIIQAALRRIIYTFS